MAGSGVASSAWAPLRIGLFRTLWIPADIFDLARLLVAVLACMTAAGAALTALTAAHRMPPALLLMFTFVLGTGAILVVPAYQSLVPDMVPRPQVPAAAALSSFSVNLARAIGPAIAGLLVARIWASAVFGLNAATFLFYAIAVACHRELGGTAQYPERFLPGLRAGGHPSQCEHQRASK
jgi:MFS family permease